MLSDPRQQCRGFAHCGLARTQRGRVAKKTRFSERADGPLETRRSVEPLRYELMVKVLSQQRNTFTSSKYRGALDKIIFRGFFHLLRSERVARSSDHEIPCGLIFKRGDSVPGSGITSALRTSSPMALLSEIPFSCAYLEAKRWTSSSRLRVVLIIQLCIIILKDAIFANDATTESGVTRKSSRQRASVNRQAAAGSSFSIAA